MVPSIILLISILIEAAAAIAAWRLIRGDAYRRLRPFVCGVVLLIAVWHALELFSLMVGDVRDPWSLRAAWLPLPFSVFLLTGITWSSRDSRGRNMARVDTESHENRTRLQSVLGALPVLVVSTDAKSERFLSFDGAPERVLGHSVNEFLSDMDLGRRVVHADDRDRVIRTFRAELKRKEPFEFECRAIHGADGRTVWLQCSVVPVLGEDGTLVRHDTVAFDITQRKEAERSLQEYRERLEELVEERTAELKMVNERLQEEIAEHRRTAASLQQSEERYRALFEAVPVGIGISDFSGNAMTCNPSMESMTGYSLAEMKSLGIHTVYADPDDRRSFIDALGKDGKVRDWEVLFRRKDGSTYTVLLSADLLTLSGETVILTSARDVTHLKQTERDLRDSERKYRTLVEHSLQGLVIVAGDPPVPVFANQALADLVGYTVDEILSMPPEGVRNMVHPEDQAMMFGRIRDRIDGKNPPSRYECRLIRKDGEMRWAEIFSVRIEYAGEPAAHAVVIDITERKQAEEALRAEKEFTEAALNAQTDTFFVFELATGNALRWNKAFRTVSGYTDEEIRSMKAPESYYGESDLTKAAAATERMVQEGSATVEMTLITKDGREIPTEYTGSLIKDSLGNPKYLIAVGRDVSERKRAEAALRESEQKYRMLVEHSLQAVVIVQGNPPRIVFSNPTMTQLSGYSTEELLSLSPDILHDGVHPEDRDMVLTNLERHLRGDSGPSRYEFRIVRKDGEVRWLEMFSTGIEYQGQRAVQGVFVDITERKRAEEALRYSEQQLRVTLDALGDAVHVVDRDLRILLVNETQHDWLRKGKRKEEIVGHRLTEVFSTLGPELEDEYRHVFNTGELLITEKKTRIEGKEYITEVRKIPLFENGEVIRVAAVLRDVTARRRAEEALRESERKYRNLIEHSLQAVVILQRDPPRIVFANSTMAEYLGFTVEELLAFTPGMLRNRIHPDDRETTIQRLFDESAGKPAPARFVSRMIRKDGEIRWVETYASALEYGGRPSVQAVLIDVTERKQTEEALRESEERYRNIFSLAPLAIMVWDKDCRIIDWNQGAEKLFGWTPEEIVGRSFPKVLIPEWDGSEVGSIMQQLAENERLRHRVNENRTKDGRTVLCEWNTSVLHGADGTVVGAISLALDITERTRAEEKLRESEESERVFRQQLADLVVIGNELSKTETFDEFCRLAVELGHERLGLDRLGITFLDGDENTTVQSFGIDEAGKLRDERNIRVPIASESRELTRQKGVLQTIVQRDTVLRDHRGKPVGRGTHVYASLWDGEKLIGFLNVDNLLSGEPFTEQKCELVTMYASTLAHLISRARAMEALREREEGERRFREQLAALIVVGNELSKAESLDDLTRQAVLLGREKLGFERLGICFLDEERRFTMGTFGTDESGRIRDERGILVPIAKEEHDLVRREAGPRLFVEQETNLHNDRGEVVGRGTHVYAGLWDGEDILGFLNADNLLTRKPITEQESEILSMYASTLGHLASRALAMEAVRRSEEIYRKAIEAAQGVPYRLHFYADSRAARFEFIGGGVASLVGTSADELTPERLAQLVEYAVPTDPTAPKDPADYEESFRQGLVDRFQSDLRIRTPQGDVKWLSSSAVPVRDDRSGDVIGSLGILQDITERRAVEEKLKQQRDELQQVNLELMAARDQALAAGRAKTAFLANISHELRTPLNAIIGFSRLVHRKTKEILPDEQRKNLEKILQSSGHLLSLIDDLLDMSKIEAGQIDVTLEEFDLGALVRETATMVQPLMQTNHNRLVTLMGEDLPQVCTDPTKIRQILLNLLSNAAKFTEEGQITLSVSCEFRDRRSGGIVLISVTDEGIGMTQEQLSYIFDPFRQADDSLTRKYSGSGLGLSISQRLAELLGGRITATSRPGEGSTFRLRLPVPFVPDRGESSKRKGGNAE